MKVCIVVVRLRPTASSISYSRLKHWYRIGWERTLSGKPQLLFARNSFASYKYLNQVTQQTLNIPWIPFCSCKFNKNKAASVPDASQRDLNKTFHTARTISLHVMIHISVLSPAAATDTLAAVQWERQWGRRIIREIQVMIQQTFRNVAKCIWQVQVH